MSRPRTLYLPCPGCAFVFVYSGDRDAGLMLADHIDFAHPAMLYERDEAERRRLTHAAQAARN